MTNETELYTYRSITIAIVVELLIGGLCFLSPETAVVRCLKLYRSDHGNVPSTIYKTRRVFQHVTRARHAVELFRGM